MDIVMRPRQGGKTYELVKLLCEEPDAVLVCADPQRKNAPYTRDMIRRVLRELRNEEIRPKELPPRPVTATDVDKVLERVLPAGSAREAIHFLRPKGRVMVDDLEDVLQVLLGPVDIATMRMPARAGREYRVHFEDQPLATAWALENEERERRRAHQRGLDMTFGVRYGAGPRGGRS